MNKLPSFTKPFFEPIHSGIGSSIITPASGPAPPAAVLWNPADKAANIVLSSGDTLAARSGGADTYQSVRGTVSRIDKPRVFALKINAAVPLGLIVGLGKATASLTQYSGQNTASIGYNCTNGFIYFNGAQSVDVGFTAAQGDTLMWAWHPILGHSFIGKNGAWYGNPATDANFLGGLSALDAVFPMASFYSGADAALTAQDLFNVATYPYALPAGFVTWDAP